MQRLHSLHAKLPRQQFRCSFAGRVIVGKYESVKKWCEKNPVQATLIKIGWYTRHQHEWPEVKRKKKCRELTTKAIRYGIIARPSCCQGCGVRCKPNAHHDDYSQLLNVRFFCRKCHNAADREREERLGIVRVKPVIREREHYQRVYDRALNLWRTGNYSQVEIGKLLGITNSCISKWVNGLTAPR